MFARISKYKGSLDKIDNGLRVTQETTPDLERLEGFMGSYVLVNRQTGEAMTITIWDSMEHLQGTTGSANPLRRRISDAFGDAGSPTVEVYEVAGVNVDRLRRAA